MPFTFFNTKNIQSLKLNFKLNFKADPNKMANGSKIAADEHLKDIPLILYLNIISVSPHFFKTFKQRPMQNSH